jgi:protein phosphatase
MKSTWPIHAAAAALVLFDAFLLLRHRADRKKRAKQLRKAEIRRKHSEHDKATLQFDTKPNMADITHTLAAASGIHQGTREYQQDSLYVDAPLIFSDKDDAQLLGIVCDGMGGMESGGAASQLAVEVFKNEFKQGITDIPRFLEDTIRLAGREVNEFTKGAGGTTLAAVIADHNKLYWGAVGDSRIYILRKGEIAQLTRDHNYFLTLSEQVKKKEITEKEAKSNPKKDALISFIGMDNLKLIDISPAPLTLQTGDIILLCSDGLTKTLTNEEISEIIFENYGNVEETARLLPVETFDRSPGGQDNIAVVLIQYDK